MLETGYIIPYRKFMKLGIYAKDLVGQKTGIGNWTAQILRELPNHIPELEIFAYIQTPYASALRVYIKSHIIRCSRPLPFMPGLFWLKLQTSQLVRHDRLDVFWATRTLYPLGIERHVPVVSTVHDLNSILYPNTMAIANLLAYKLWFANDLRNADRIVANSQGTSDRLNSWLGRSADAIVRPGVAEYYTPQAHDIIHNVMQKYGISAPYLLFVGTSEPRKNLGNILKALEVINKNRSIPLNLVLIGQRGWKNRKLHRQLDKSIPNVKELGFVLDEDLPGLYSGAAALLIPSLYEGYGMPAAEAAACGIRVVATDIPELREAAGSSGVYIQPSVEGIVSGILEALALGSPATPPQSVSWRASAATLASILLEAAACRQTGH